MVVYTLPSNAKTLLGVGISSLHDNHAIRTVSTVVHITTLSFSCNVNIVKWLAIFSTDFFFACYAIVVRCFCAHHFLWLTL